MRKETDKAVSTKEELRNLSEWPHQSTTNRPSAATTAGEGRETDLHHRDLTLKCGTYTSDAKDDIEVGDDVKSKSFAFDVHRSSNDGHAVPPVVDVSGQSRMEDMLEEPLASHRESEEEGMVTELNAAGLTENTKRKTPPRCIHHAEQVPKDSDSEVQVLLTVQPPTPKRPKRKELDLSQAVENETDARRVSTSPQPDNSARQRSSCNDSLDQVPFSFQSSAYVQTLAEICFTILHDARWRVQGSSQKSLLAWEYGEDMSAVLALSRLFVPPKRSCSKCTCLLCREKENVDTQRSSEDEFKHVFSDLERKRGDSRSLRPPLRPQVDEETIRALYLYCRLYYRKGPWFRLDTIYKSYYAPKKRSKSPANSEESTASSTVSENDRCGDLADRRSSFFKRSSSADVKTTGSSSQARKDQVIDQAELEQHIGAVAFMFRDVERLHETGLVRSFQSEEECGKTVGQVTPEGHGVVLRAGERRGIVAKLGGRTNKDRNRRTTKSASTVGATSGRPSRFVTSENIIWKQMCQQTSISATLLSKAMGTRPLLPVCRHVNDALLEKLASSIVVASSEVDYVPAFIFRSAVSDVKARILGLLQPSSKAFCMCLKLREAPLLALRRCARLFLCATSGPGDMRGDGTNAWRSLNEIDFASIHPDIPLATVVQPPGSYSWHRVQYPALSHRFGITSCAFIDAHEFLELESAESDIENEYSLPTIQAHAKRATTQIVHAQVFRTVDEFRMWELCVEVRANVDYHLELNDLLAYNARRRARERESSENHEPREHRNARDGHVNVGKDSVENPCLVFTSTCNVSVDLVEVMTTGGRKSMISTMVAYGMGDRVVSEILEEVESAISELEAIVLSEKEQKAKVDEAIGELSYSERIVIVFSIIILKVLSTRNHAILAEDLVLKRARPWLRHLSWEGILAYALWDCVPVLERRGFYGLACSCLEVLLFGKVQDRTVVWASKAGKNDDPFEKKTLAQLLLSRRTRGKALERLMIDYVHLLRWKNKPCTFNSCDCMDPALAKSAKQARKNNALLVSSPLETVRAVCSRVVGTAARAGTVPFSAVRSLARRMKAPLADSLGGVACSEVSALGFRLDNRINASTTNDEKSGEKGKGYFDWLPPMDQAVANAMAGEETIVGKRCSYVGFEEHPEGKADMSALNVEELAMQYYSSGRLPSSGSDGTISGGGWFGWHDEGGHVRALFRIICAHPILGMESGCGKESSNPLDSLESLTIHLTPYQGAPFDLHVAHSEHSLPADNADEMQGDDMYVRSFYQRRRKQIDSFLSKLECLGTQEISDLVYDSVVCRLGRGRVQDKLLARDLQQIRTLSMLAVGFGGRMLSAMFRCFLFDYRHYSGGLPDLLLVRAFTTCTADAMEEKALIDLGEWIGEEFSPESKTDKEASSYSRLLIDKDDEFLGCIKIGDSGKTTNQRRQGAFQRVARRINEAKESDQYSLQKLPPKLNLLHNNEDVQVQCLFVEVKSQNDRLDSRQEDWLNVLDRVGNARVCKFGNGKTKGKGASTKAHH